MRQLLIGLALASALPVALAAQGKPRWKQIGTTSSGNPVYVDPRSVKKQGALVSADVRVVFLTPVKASRGTWGSSRTSATVDCTRKLLAARENVFYADAAGTKVTERKVNKIPGYGTTFQGSLGGVALEYLCSH